MVYELFQTYLRCGFVREEFQAKVIALVMDGAKPILNNNLALTSLAKEWKDKYKDQHQHLEDVDPDRFSTSSWAFLNLIKEMCPRLPDMLALLRDIVMKRGFDEIVADNFQEVLKRLPPIEKNLTRSQRSPDGACRIRDYQSHERPVFCFFDSSDSSVRHAYEEPSVDTCRRSKVQL
jgi:hypothetical protein